MAIEAEAALTAADAADAALAKGKIRRPLHGVPLAHKDMYYDAGKVVDLRLEDPPRFRARPTTSTALQRLKDAGTVRLGSLQMVEFAYGPTGHNPHYGAVRNPWNVDHITGGSSSGSGSAVAARLTFAALGSDTGGSIRMPAHFCGVTGFKTTVGRDQPRRRDAAVAVARHRRPAGAHRRGLRAAARADGRRRSRTIRPRRRAPVPDYMAATRRLAQGPDDRRAHARSMSTISMPRWRACSTRRSRRSKSEGAEIVKVELPDQRQLSRRVPDRARDRGRRLPQALDDRAAAGLRRAGPDAAAERACHSGGDLSRGDALARSRARRPSRGGHRNATR